MLGPSCGPAATLPCASSSRSCFSRSRSSIQSRRESSRTFQTRPRLPSTISARRSSLWQALLIVSELHPAILAAAPVLSILILLSCGRATLLSSCCVRLAVVRANCCLEKLSTKAANAAFKRKKRSFNSDYRGAAVLPLSCSPATRTPTLTTWPFWLSCKDSKILQAKYHGHRQGRVQMKKPPSPQRRFFESWGLRESTKSISDFKSSHPQA